MCYIMMADGFTLLTKEEEAKLLLGVDNKKTTNKRR